MKGFGHRWNRCSQQSNAALQVDEALEILIANDSLVVQADSDLNKHCGAEDPEEKGHQIMGGYRLSCPSLLEGCIMLGLAAQCKPQQYWGPGG